MCIRNTQFTDNYTYLKMLTEKVIYILGFTLCHDKIQTVIRPCWPHTSYSLTMYLDKLHSLVSKTNHFVGEFSSVSPVIRRDTSLWFCKNCIKQFVYKDTSPAHNCEICLCLQLNSSIISSQGQSWCDADLSYPYSAKVKNGWNWAPLPLCTLTQCIGTVSPFISSKEVSCVESSTDGVNMYGG